MSYIQQLVQTFHCKYVEKAIDDQTPCIIGRFYSTCRQVKRMLLTAYGRSVLVYKMYQVSFPRDIYRRSSMQLKWGSENINNRQTLSKIVLMALFTDYRTTSNDNMLATHSHLLPIQPAGASSLLPSLLGGTCPQTRWVTPSIIDRRNWFLL